MKIGRTVFGFGALLGVVLIVLALWFLPVNSRYVQKDLSFDFEGSVIAAKLALPLGNISNPIDCLVFVHGDGAMPYDGFGYFTPYFAEFADRGYCSLSWDKPGVDGSSGNWLSFSMQDRARLVQRAIEALRESSHVEVDRVGLIGFSQAGWVMPKVDTQAHDVQFAIYVSPAINWLCQSAYMSSLRSTVAMKDVLDNPDTVTQLLLGGKDYGAFLALPDSDPSAFSKERWEFVGKNINSDMTIDLQSAENHPVLLLTGQNDGQVDAMETRSVFRQVLEPQTLQSHHFEGAGHSMLDVSERRPMDERDGLWTLTQVHLFGRDAFTNGYWAVLNGFITAQFETAN